MTNNLKLIQSRRFRIFIISLLSVTIFFIFFIYLLLFNETTVFYQISPSMNSKIYIDIKMAPLNGTSYSTIYYKKQGDLTRTELFFTPIGGDDGEIMPDSYNVEWIDYDKCRITIRFLEQTEIYEVNIEENSKWKK